jgi:sugar lactone lactonase YvrE
MMNSESLNTGDRKRRRSRAAFGAVVSVMLPLAVSSVATAASNEISIPGDHTFPESITGTSHDTLFIGSLADGAVFRVASGGSIAQPFIAPGASDLMSVVGVLADEKSGTLWVCSSDLSAAGVIVPTGKKPSSLRAFDINTGAAKGIVPLPGAKQFCQDIAIGKDGAIYVTDQLNPTILRLKSGATSFEVWAKDDRFGGEGYNLDGICFGSDGSLYVNTYTSGRLFRVAVRVDGSAGTVTELEPSRRLEHPDAMRLLARNTFLMIETAGRLDRVTVEGDRAKIEVLREGLKVPVSVWQVGDTAWVLEGQLDVLFDPAKNGSKPEPFRVVAVSVKKSAAPN